MLGFVRLRATDLSVDNVSAAQSDKKQQHITRIQSLDEWIQRELMYSIEQVRGFSRLLS